MGLGVEISRRLRRFNPRADPLVCAAGLLGSAPFLFLSLACARGSIVATYVSRMPGVWWVSLHGGRRGSTAFPGTSMSTEDDCQQPVPCAGSASRVVQSRLKVERLLSNLSSGPPLLGNAGQAA